MVLVLFETAAGYALFKLHDDAKLQKVDQLARDFENPTQAQKLVSLQNFARFKNTSEALKATTALMKSKLSKSLKSFLTKQVVDKGLKESLAVADSKLGGVIKEKLGIPCIHDPSVDELIRCIRSQVQTLISDVSPSDMSAMSLGLSHSLSRYKLKFSPDKVDTMIVQAIGLLDELDKELNTYAMRVREWYGWHFPELSKILADNILFAKVVKLMGFRSSANSTDFSSILPEELEEEVKEAANVSMGTEISDEDISNITDLCDQVLSISEYREQLYDYLKNRMQAIAPNLTVLVGELVGARLIAHAGSLMNLAKYPASTVQILGAEKALFRALKTHHETPKYGLIFHASLVGQTAPKFKGRISRVLAAKAALASRYDALVEAQASGALKAEEAEEGTEETAQTHDTTLGSESRAKVEQRIKSLETGAVHKISGNGKQSKKIQKFDTNQQTHSAAKFSYDASADSTAKKSKKIAQPEAMEAVADEVAPVEEKPKSKKKKAVEDAAPADENTPKKVKASAEQSEAPSSGKRKKNTNAN